jgi:hypothetical protein
MLRFRCEAKCLDGPAPFAHLSAGGNRIWALLPVERKIASARESFEESSKLRDKYPARMRRDRFENSAANELQQRFDANC